MAGTLVNIQPLDLSHRASRALGQMEHEEDTLATFVANVQNPPPPEYTELAAALTEFWMAVGAGKLCSACFAGQLGEYHSKGCCGGCTHLSTKGCVAKPIGCAAFSCYDLHELIPNDENEKLVNRWLRDVLEHRKWRGDYLDNYPFYDRGYSAARTRDWSDEDKKQLKLYARYFKRMAAKVRESGYVPDYKKLFPHAPAFSS
jgi:hypothetical protein